MSVGVSGNSNHWLESYRYSKIVYYVANGPEK